ncbi:MAG: hypothetical protein M3P18_03055 [Actinomycetota bacterium]|nr:hypothetical protein [Actinomycetota bacterium]
MPVHLRERELLAQLVTVAIVRVDVDHSLVEERLVQTVQLLANRFLLPLDLGDPLRRVRFHPAPRVQHAVFHETHEAGSWLKPAQLVDEKVFELGLADVHGAASPTTVVIRVVVAASLRPARGQRFAARLAPDVPA